MIQYYNTPSEWVNWHVQLSWMSCEVSVILCPGRYDAQSVCRECVLHMYVFTEGDSNVVWACPTLTLAIRFNKMLEASFEMLVYIENYAALSAEHLRCRAPDIRYGSQ